MKIKCIFIGNSGVGKTSLINKICNINTTSNTPTIGVSYQCVKYKLLDVHIWDTAGQERFRSICRCFYRSSDLVFIVYDITNQESYNDLDYWMDEVKDLSNIVILGNKSDNKMGDDETSEIINNEKRKHYYVSKYDDRINTIFDNEVEKIYELMNINEKETVIEIKEDSYYKCCIG